MRLPHERERSSDDEKSPETDLSPSRDSEEEDDSSTGRAWTFQRLSRGLFVDMRDPDDGNWYPVEVLCILEISQ